MQNRLRAVVLADNTIAQVKQKDLQRIGISTAKM